MFKFPRSAREIHQRVHEVHLEPFFKSYPKFRVGSELLGTRAIPQHDEIVLLPFQRHNLQQHSDLHWYLANVTKNKPALLVEGADAVARDSVVAISGEPKRGTATKVWFARVINILERTETNTETSTETETNIETSIERSTTTSSEMSPETATETETFIEFEVQYFDLTNGSTTWYKLLPSTTIVPKETVICSGVPLHPQVSFKDGETEILWKVLLGKETLQALTNTAEAVVIAPNSASKMKSYKETKATARNKSLFWNGPGGLLDLIGSWSIQVDE